MLATYLHAVMTLRMYGDEPQLCHTSSCYGDNFTSFREGVTEQSSPWFVVFYRRPQLVHSLAFPVTYVNRKDTEGFAFWRK
jgi:hypothetical protein